MRPRVGVEALPLWDAAAVEVEVARLAEPTVVQLGQAEVAAHAARHGDLLARLRVRMREMAVDGQVVTTDIAHAILDEWGAPADFGGNRRFLGALWGNEWEAVGWCKSERVQNHGRDVRMWRLRA